MAANKSPAPEQSGVGPLFLSFPVEQPVYGNLEDIGDGAQFFIGDGSLLPFQQGQGGNTHFYTQKLKPGKKLNLLHAPLFTYLCYARANDVSISQRQLPGIQNTIPYPMKL